MARKRKGSPRIEFEITDADRRSAIDSNSGGCLIADALKRIGYTKVSVDMATIRVTDRKEGKRYTYLTPPTAQHLLLSFDQGWPDEGGTVVLQRAVKILSVTTSPSEKAKRAERLAELEAKEAEGTLTGQEAAALGRIRSTPARPSSKGKAKVAGDGTVVGGRPMVQGPPHPNLLRGRNRIFGAKVADPGKAFEQAVVAEVEARG